MVRFLHTDAVLLDHVVGAGKTLTITASCMEAKRLGLVRQPWVVVPNHLLAQWSVEVRDAYPNAKLLVAADLDGVEDRQRFVGQTAVTDWDLVIVPQSVFTKIPMKRQAQIDYLEGEVADMARALDEAAAADREFSVKQIEAALKKTRQRIETILGQKSTDTGLTFEQTGCDALYIDFTDRRNSCTRRSSCVTFGTSRGCLPTRSGMSVTFGRRRLCGTASGDRRSAGAADRAAGRSAVVDDRLARGDRASGGRSVPA